jgi:hypothetical protein
MVTGDSMMRSGVLDADTTISLRLSSSLKTTLIFWLAEATFTSFDKKPILVTCILKEIQGCAQGKFSVNIRDCSPAPL